jgi:hypothetical protein
MNLYVRYFDHEFLAKTVDEALSFLTSIDEIKLESNAAVRISTFLNSSNLYPFRLKVSYSNYVLFLKTEAETLEQFKEEEKYIKRQQARSENFQEDVLECINISLEFLGEEKMKGKFGYSFTQHIASSTKPDTKLIKELFYKDVEKAIRDAHVCPDHITFTLSASSSLLKEGEDKPDYFTTTTRARAKYLKPRKSKEQEELKTDEF